MKLYVPASELSEAAQAVEEGRMQQHEANLAIRDVRRSQPGVWDRVVAKVGRLFTRVMFIVCWNFARKGK